MGDLSISNISQNSKIKVSRVGGTQVLDISECLSGLNLSSERVLEEEGERLELKLPMEAVRGLRADEKSVLAVQRVRVNGRGEREEVQELYEIVASSNGFELVKSPEVVTQ